GPTTVARPRPGAARAAPARARRRGARGRGWTGAPPPLASKCGMRPPFAAKRGSADGRAQGQVEDDARERAYDPAIHPLGKKFLPKMMDHPNSGLPEFGNFSAQVG